MWLRVTQPSGCNTFIYDIEIKSCEEKWVKFGSNGDIDVGDGYSRQKHCSQPKTLALNFELVNSVWIISLSNFQIEFWIFLKPW